MNKPDYEKNYTASDDANGGPKVGTAGTAESIRGAEMTRTLAAFADDPNPDGSLDAIVDHNGEQLEVNISLQQVQQLIAKFQAQIFEMGTQCPYLAVNRIGVAGKDATGELMVSTIQTGPVVLAMSNADLRHMKKQIDNVLAIRGGSPVQN